MDNHDRRRSELEGPFELEDGLIDAPEKRQGHRQVTLNLVVVGKRPGGDFQLGQCILRAPRLEIRSAQIGTKQGLPGTEATLSSHSEMSSCQTAHARASSPRRVATIPREESQRLRILAPALQTQRRATTSRLKPTEGR